MTLDDLKAYDLVYLATPYTKYPGGLEAAFWGACRLAARLLLAGVGAYSPTAHTHPIAEYGGLDKKDHALWLPFDSIMWKKSDALLVAMMAGWRDSYGVDCEIKDFLAAGKPVFYLDPWTMLVSREPPHE